MDKIIEIIAARVAILLGYPPYFISSGDPQSPDFGPGGWDDDHNWHDLDLSSIIPTNAKAILFNASTLASVIENRFEVRTKGNTALYSISTLITQAAGTTVQEDCVCPVDEARKVEYRMTVGNWTGLFFTVKGWWL